MNYVPKPQDIIWINFQPSKGEEIYGRHPAVVISIPGYSIITGLVAVSPITHAKHNRLKQFFIPINAGKINGYINALQFYTFSIKWRNVEPTGLIIPDQTFYQVIKTHTEIIDY